jgi:hypothetical protein
LRTLTQGITLSDTRNISTVFKRTAAQIVQVNEITKSFFTILMKIIETVKSFDKKYFSVLFVRSICETKKIIDTLRYFRIFFRWLTDNAHIESEAKSGWALFTKIVDTIRASGTVLKGLIFFVRIVTSFFVRDYLLGRFLKSKEELVFKSVVCREVTLDSRIV